MEEVMGKVGFVYFEYEMNGKEHDRNMQNSIETVVWEFLWS